MSTDGPFEELLAPAGIELEQALSALARQLTLREGDRHDARLSFFDTFDGRIRAAGLTVVHEQGPRRPAPGRLSLSDRDSFIEQAGVQAPAPTGPTPARELPAGELRDSLLSVLDVRALLPLVAVQERRQEFVVLDDEQKTIARGELRAPTLVDDGRDALALRVALQPLRGYDAELSQIRERLLEAGFGPRRHRLVDEAVIAGGGSPGGTSSKIAVELIGAQRTDTAVAAVLRRLAEVMDVNIDGAIAAIDAEFLHDFRVAVRRSRAVQKELRGAFPPWELERFRTEFRRLQRVTGEARDLDVYVLEFDAMRALVPGRIRGELDPVRVVLSRRRELAHEATARELRSEETTRLRGDWDALLEELVGLPTEDRSDAERAIGELAGARIARVYRKIVKLGRAIDDTSPADEYHGVRKKGKELRYLLELFGKPLYPPEVVGPMISALKSLQDVLGRHQDREVQIGLLHGLADELAQEPGGPVALMATGVLVERLREDELEARAQFAQRFAAFSKKRLRRQVKETFT